MTGPGPDGGGNGAAPQPEVAAAPTPLVVQLVLNGDQLQLNESPGDDLQKLKMLATANQVILARILAGKSAGGIILPAGRHGMGLV
jgi:hypothetical protein